MQFAHMRPTFLIVNLQRSRPTFLVEIEAAWVGCHDTGCCSNGPTQCCSNKHDGDVLHQPGTPSGGYRCIHQGATAGPLYHRCLDKCRRGTQRGKSAIATHAVSPLLRKQGRSGTRRTRELPKTCCWQEIQHGACHMRAEVGARRSL